MMDQQRRKLISDTAVIEKPLLLANLLTYLIAKLKTVMRNTSFAHIISSLKWAKEFAEE